MKWVNFPAPWQPLLEFEMSLKMKENGREEPWKPEGRGEV